MRYQREIKVVGDENGRARMGGHGKNNVRQTVTYSTIAKNLLKESSTIAILFR